MSDFTEGYDYVVARKNVGKWKTRRILLVLGYVVYTILFWGVIFAVNSPWAGFFYPVTLAMLVFFTWRYVSFDYEYIVNSGTLKFSIVRKAFNHRIRKPQLELQLHDCVTIAPFRDQYLAEHDAFAPTKKFYGLSCDDAPDRYYALFVNKNGEHCAYYFEATEKMLKLCRNHCSNTIKEKVSI